VMKRVCDYLEIQFYPEGCFDAYEDWSTVGGEFGGADSVFSSER